MRRIGVLRVHRAAHPFGACGSFFVREDPQSACIPSVILEEPSATKDRFKFFTALKGDKGLYAAGSNGSGNLVGATLAVARTMCPFSLQITPTPPRRPCAVSALGFGFKFGLGFVFGLDSDSCRDPQRSAATCGELRRSAATCGEPRRARPPKRAAAPRIGSALSDPPVPTVSSHHEYVFPVFRLFRQNRQIVYPLRYGAFRTRPDPKGEDVFRVFRLLRQNAEFRPERRKIPALSAFWINRRAVFLSQ